MEWCKKWLLASVVMQISAKELFIKFNQWSLRRSSSNWQSHYSSPPGSSRPLTNVQIFLFYFAKELLPLILISVLLEKPQSKFQSLHQIRFRTVAGLAPSLFCCRRCFSGDLATLKLVSTVGLPSLLLAVRRGFWLSILDFCWNITYCDFIFVIRVINLFRSSVKKTNCNIMFVRKAAHAGSWYSDSGKKFASLFCSLSSTWCYHWYLYIFFQPRSWTGSLEDGLLLLICPMVLLVLSFPRKKLCLVWGWFVYSLVVFLIVSGTLATATVDHVQAMPTVRLIPPLCKFLMVDCMGLHEIFNLFMQEACFYFGSITPCEAVRLCSVFSHQVQHTLIWSHYWLSG